jgi:hypothetical protein
MNTYELRVDGTSQSVRLGATNREEAAACAKIISKNNIGHVVFVIENGITFQSWLDEKVVEQEKVTK